MLFENTPQPPEQLKRAWRKMIPDWSWNAMRHEVRKILIRERQRNSPDEVIERAIYNAHVFIRGEAFLPECFLVDIVMEVEEGFK